MFFLVCLCSCGAKESKEDMVIRMLGEELEEANSKINTATKDLYQKLAAKTEDYKLRERALLYSEKAEMVKVETEIICNYLDSISALKNIDWDETNIRLRKCKEKYIIADNEVELGYFNDKKKIPFTLDSISVPNGYLTFLNNLNKASRIAMLSKIKNNIRNMEYNILRHYDDNTTPGCNLGNFNSFGILVGQSTTHLRIGEQLEISAGVGAFSSAAKPLISIANKKIETINGQGTYKTKVNGAVGKHTIPVRIEFIDESGNLQTKTVTVEYTIDK